jgi:hypothetical protein
MTSGVEVVVGGFLHNDHMDDRKHNLIIYPWNDNNNDVDDDAATANRSSNHSHDFYLMHQQLLRAIARGDLLSVRRIVESISLSNEDEQQQQQQWRSMLINHAEIWTETPPSSSPSVGGNNNNRAVLRLREATATTTTMPRTTESSIQLGNVGYKFRKQFTAGWFTGTVVQILPLVHNTTSTTTTNDTTKKEDGGLEEVGGDKKHDNYYRRCVYTDGDSEDLTVEDIIQLVKLDPNTNKCSSRNNNNDTITNNVVKEEKDEESTKNNNNGVVMSSNTAASSSTSTSSTSVIQQLEWYDITPLTLAVTRGHDDIVEYLLRLGADPTLMGYPKNQLQYPDTNNNDNNIKAHNSNIMDAYIASSKLCNMIRGCRRTQDLLLSVKPFWKKASYYGSSVTTASSSSAAAVAVTTTTLSNNKLRTEYTNVPIHTTWMLMAIDQVPKIVDYPLVCLNYNESMFVNATYWKTKMYDYSKVIKDTKLTASSTTTNDSWIEVGQSRRCSSCQEYKPVQSYYKNEKKKGVLARCISCVATNPETLDLLLLHNNNNNNNNNSSSSRLIPPISTTHATPATSSAAADGNSKINVTQQSTTTPTTMMEGKVKFELDDNKNNNNDNNPFQNDNIKRRKVE